MIAVVSAEHEPPDFLGQLGPFLLVSRAVSRADVHVMAHLIERLGYDAANLDLVGRESHCSSPFQQSKADRSFMGPSVP